MNRFLVSGKGSSPLFVVNAAHSEFYGGMIGGYALSCIFTNCLMDRMGGGQFQGYSGNAYILQNCTWHGGWLTLTPTSPISVIIRDSAFDGTRVTLGRGHPYFCPNCG
jgi:hypothetical protein